jgi:hypothetical protein
VFICIVATRINFALGIAEIKLNFLNFASGRNKIEQKIAETERHQIAQQRGDARFSGISEHSSLICHSNGVNY